MFHIREFINTAVRRQQRMKEIELELRALELKVPELASQVLMITESWCVFVLPKEYLAKLRKHGVNWDRSTVRPLHVTKAEERKVMFEASISERVKLRWEDVYIPKEGDKCQWTTEWVPESHVPGRTIHSLECER